MTTLRTILLAEDSPADAEMAIEMIFRDLPQGCAFGDGGIGKDDIELAVVLRDDGHDALKIVQPRYVGGDAHGGLTQLGDRVLQLLFAPTDQEDGGAFLDEFSCGRQTDPGGRAGNECCLAL